MMGPKQVVHGALFYEFSIQESVPQDHPVRGVDRFLDLSDVRPFLDPSDSSQNSKLATYFNHTSHLQFIDVCQ